MERTDVVFDIETTGLNPLVDRVVSIGIKIGVENMLIMDKDEIVMLKRFWNGLRSYEWFRLISFNGSTFDIPFLNLRSLLHKVEVVDVRGKHVDLRFVLNYGQKFGNGKLQEYADFLGIDGKYNGIDGSMVPLLQPYGTHRVHIHTRCRSEFLCRSQKCTNNREKPIIKVQRPVKRQP